MAARHRNGLMHYNPTAAVAARFRKTVAGPKQVAKAAARAAAKGRLPKPGSNAASRIADRFLPNTDEVRFLKRAATAEVLSREGPGPYVAELRELRERSYRAAYNARQKARRAEKPKAKSPWVRVKSYRRKRPGK